MDRCLRLVLAYDGAQFHGWQRQPGVRTVQEELEGVLMHILRHPLTAHGASRTDAGVHAHGQVVSVRTTSAIPAENLLRAIGHHLPQDIALLHVADAAADFHASRAARGKLYRYRVHNRAVRPAADMTSQHVWHVWYPLDLDAMRVAAASLVGTHDFRGFASQGSPRETTVRTIRRFEVHRRWSEVVLDAEGDGFLYHQVRNMVGTVVEIGRGQWSAERAGEILAAGDRRMAGPTAPPQGLCLEWVRYGPLKPLACASGSVQDTAKDTRRPVNGTA